MNRDLYVAGTGRWLPGVLTVEEAALAGLCNPGLVWSAGMASVCVADGEAAPDMAARAARSALRTARCDPADVALLLHASTWYQGHDLWPPASYVQRVALGDRSGCPAFEVRQMSNGGMAALELAASYLAAEPARRAALVTTGDAFRLPGYDRWHSDQGTVCGDGGTALVLSATDGWARLCSIATASDPGLERMTRGDDAFGGEPFTVRKPVDLTTNRAAFLRDLGLDEMLDRVDAGQRAAIDRALSEARAALDDIDWYVLPHLGRSRLRAHFWEPFGIDHERTTWPWGRTVGHLGAGDQIAGLDHLAASGRLAPGQRCLLAGVGAGFTWSAAVVQVCRPPS